MRGFSRRILHLHNESCPSLKQHLNIICFYRLFFKEFALATNKRLLKYATEKKLFSLFQAGFRCCAFPCSGNTAKPPEIRSCSNLFLLVSKLMASSASQTLCFANTQKRSDAAIPLPYRSFPKHSAKNRVILLILRFLLSDITFCYP